ncbi:MAG: beta-ketoacyl-ACP synthase II [Gemmatimonadaceae bacterium]|nr:beta-ketoacyl-ACP synthase II [Gemmatimonadaceae bacterium]
MTRRRTVVTGIGVLSPIGIGHQAMWDAAMAGASGVAPITLFDASPLATRFAAEVKGFVPEDFMERKQARRFDRYQQFSMAAGELAMRDAGLTAAPGDGTRAAIVVGSCVGGLSCAETAVHETGLRDPRSVTPFFILNVLANMAASHLSIRFGFRGPCWSTNSACATSTHSLGDAARLIERGDADVVLAGGAEAPIGFMCIAGFNAIRALSTRNDEPATACRPFDVTRDGFVLGEGAAVFVLESAEHAAERGARVHAELAGYGSSADAFHLTSPAPEHDGAQRCMRAALADAALAPSDIDYINAHATGTPQGDIAEATAIRAVFGAHAERIPVSASKSMIGHLTGAAGAAEAALAILSMTHGRLPPTINLTSQDPAVALDCVPNVPRTAHPCAVLTNSFGFGGTNASLVFRAPHER